MNYLELFVQIINVELLLGIGGVILNLLVLPTLLDENATVPRTQSVLSSVVLLFFFAIPYMYMGFHIPGTANLIGVALWAFVAIYRAPSSNKNYTNHSQNVNTQPAD